MPRILLIHWNSAEAQARAQLLQKAGYQVERFSTQGGEGLKAFRDKPPQAFVIDLNRLPSHGRAVAIALRQRKATRLVPIVFVEGDAEKVGRIREQLPDATYTTWQRIGSAIERAIRKPPSAPIVPDTMSAYVGTPLTKKLAIRDGTLVALLGAPKDFERQLEPLPVNVRLQRNSRGGPALSAVEGPKLVLLFVKNHAELESRFTAAAESIQDKGAIWIVWPKKSSSIQSDLTQVTVRKFGLDRGYVDYKICAIDDTWTGLLFRKRSR